MKLSTFVPGGRRARLGAVGVTLVALFSAALLAVVSTAQAAATAVNLGTAASFVVLAGTGVTNTGPTTLNGDIGTYPTTSITGTSTLTVHGTNHAGDLVTQGAKGALKTAYNVAAGEGPTKPIAAGLGGRTLTPGVYNSGSAILLNGVLTLNGGGNAAAAFVFQAGSGLTTSVGSKVSLINGAQACNVFWQVGSTAIIKGGSHFVGTILALTSITLGAGATVDGRVLARNGDVTLDANTITKPTCATGSTTTTTTSPTSSSTTTTTVSAVPPVVPPGFTG